jgi:glycosyltransferase involved in cell wall biosynthesis
MFVMSSKREGVPVSLLEAMAYGLPIVATRVGGIPEVLADGVEGTLCKPGDPAGLAQAIAALVDDDSQRIAFARSARKRAERNYGIHALADNMTQMYRELLSGHQQR